MKKLLTILAILFSFVGNAQCDMEIISFNPQTLDITIGVISGENCGSPTDSIGEFLLGITTEPQLDPNGLPSCFYDNGWALLIFPINFVLVDVNAPGAWLQSGDIIEFNIIDAFIAGSDASLCWQETINNGFFEDYCWQLAITQINDSYTFPYEDGGLGGFEYPDVTPENNIIGFSPFNPDCNTLETFESNPCLDPSLYIPNTFTPNGDGKNESFRPVITSPPECWLFWEFKIYNRWGNIIFESDYPGQQWLGDVNGGNHYAIDGVYTWKLRARHRYGKWYDQQGHVTLFR